MGIFVIANSRIPSIIAQNIGRELYHGREEMVQIIGNKHTLETIAWIFQKAPDMFEVRLNANSLIVSRIKGQLEAERFRLKEVEAGVALLTPELIPVAD